jgi:superfamily II DNA helicase RecQ
LSNKRLFLLFVIGEAHSICLQGHFFRPEFQTGITDFPQFENLSTDIPLLVISATLRSIDQQEIITASLPQPCLPMPNCGTHIFSTIDSF